MGYDRIEFGEQKYSDLLDKFMDRNSEQFEKFIDQEYELYLQGTSYAFVDEENGLYDTDLTGSDQESYSN